MTGSRRRLRQSLRRHTTYAVRSQLREAAREVELASSHAATVRVLRGLTHPDGLRLNVGYGPKFKTGWVNLDMHSDAEYRVDLREGLPLPTASAVIVYAEHFLEHLDYPDPASGFLADCHRVLRPGGTLSLGLPIIEHEISAYADENAVFFEGIKRWRPDWSTTPGHSVNYLFRQSGEHRFGYDEETLFAVLAKAGFIDIDRREWDPDLDSPERRGGAYFRATRPRR